MYGIFNGTLIRMLGTGACLTPVAHLLAKLTPWLLYVATLCMRRSINIGSSLPSKQTVSGTGLNKPALSLFKYHNNKRT